MTSTRRARPPRPAARREGERERPRGARLAGALALAACAAATLACSRPAATPPGLGRKLLDGDALAVRASADGRFIAALRACKPRPERTLPPGTASCALDVVPATGGEPVRVAEGVTTLPAGFAWSATGHALAALGRYDYASGEGTLVAFTGAAPKAVAERVSFYELGREGRTLGFTDAAGVGLAELTEAAAPPLRLALPGAGGLELGAEPGTGLVRATARGGELLALRGGTLSALAPRPGPYAFAPDGRAVAFVGGERGALFAATSLGGAPGAPRGESVRDFLLAPDGAEVAFLSGPPGRASALWRAKVAGGAPVKLSDRGAEPRWSARGGVLAWLEAYDQRGRTGALAVSVAGGPARKLSPHVSDFDLAPDGDAVAYLVHTTAGGYSVDLALRGLAAASAPQEAKVARGVFGFSFSPDGKWLYYRSGCIREAEACELSRVAVVAGAPGKPEAVAHEVKSYEHAPGRPERLLLGWARKDRIALDLGFWDGGKTTGIDTSARPGTAQFVGGDARRVTYAVNDPKRFGVYLADLP